jgi:hypothetical protein
MQGHSAVKGIMSSQDCSCFIPPPPPHLNQKFVLSQLKWRWMLIMLSQLTKFYVCIVFEICFTAVIK